jgi:hypothetical protein
MSEIIVLTEKDTKEYHERFYVYVYLDPRKPGRYSYDGLDVSFLFEPFYVGKGEGKRYKFHMREAQTDNKNSNKLKINKIRKILKLNTIPFIVLLKQDTLENDAHLNEIFYIEKIGRVLEKNGPLTNIAKGGDGCSRPCSEITKTRIGNANRGKKRSNEVKEKMSLERKGKKQPEGFSEKLSKSRKGIPKTEEHKRKLSESQLGEKGNFYGKHHTEETKKKISLSNKGRKVLMSKETSQKISHTLKERYKIHPNSMTGKKTFGRNQT